MSRLSRTATTLAASALAVAAALPAAAATVTETTDYSSIWASPTAISAGTTSISGSATNGDHDVFAISGLSAGAQVITITLSLIDRYVSGYLNAGGTVFYSSTGFIQNWDWTAATKLMDVGYNSGSGWSQGNTVSSTDIVLGDSFAGGTLYLALAFTYGDRGVDYTIGVPATISDTASRGSSDTPAVPLPAGIILLGSALGAGGLASLRRRKAA